MFGSARDFQESLALLTELQEILFPQSFVAMAVGGGVGVMER